MNLALGLTPRTLARAALYGIAAGAATTLLIGIPTDVIPNDVFTRMTPTRPQDYAFLAVTAIMAALLGASYALPAACPLQEGKLATGGFLSFLAVGCPACNKLIVLLIGTTGAYSYFEPLQPVLAVASTLLMGYALWLRYRAVSAATGLALPGQVSERS